MSAGLVDIPSGQKVVYRFNPPITTRRDLRLFLKYAWGVSIPDKIVCKGHSSPWDVFCAAYFAENPVIIVKGSRGLSGKSTWLSILGLTEAVTLGADVDILGGSGAQSKRVHEAMHQLWNHDKLDQGGGRAPRYLLKGEPGAHVTTLETGATVTALLASQTSVRGGHPARLRLDEIDEMKLAILDAAMGRPMPQPSKAVPGMIVQSQTTAVSTHQHSAGTMAEMMERATGEKIDYGWRLAEWCYRESLTPHGWLDETTVQRKRADMTKLAWQVEVELQEPSAEGLAIFPANANAMFDEELGSFRGEEGEEIEVEPPDPKGLYAHGADWGQSAHWTVVVTLRYDVRPMRLVAFRRDGRRSWPDLVAILDERIDRYGVANSTALHDGTGVGRVVKNLLRHEGGAARGEDMVGRDRTQLFSDYISGIERHEIVSPRIEWMRSEHKHCTKRDLLPGGHPPDSFVGGAHAYRAAMRAIAGGATSVAPAGAKSSPRWRPPSSMEDE